MLDPEGWSQKEQVGKKEVRQGGENASERHSMKVKADLWVCRSQL